MIHGLESPSGGRLQVPGLHPSEVRIPIGEACLEGTLLVPTGARGVVAFVHGSGSSRFSPRNRFVAEVLRTGGVGTLLMDLLTPEEERIDLRTRHLRFDIGMLTDRAGGVVEWLGRIDPIRDLPVGLFGSSTGAAAALGAAAVHPERVRAVVSRGGRPDLAGPILDRVRAATLLLVGERDREVLNLNREALEGLVAARERKLAVIPGATHLFEEPGALEEVARIARDWFRTHLALSDPSDPDRAAPGPAPRDAGSRPAAGH
jgi:pimeloyl-ACP methyl ester carboxylesterase